MSEWTAGFARPWITFDGVEGDGPAAGVVTVDGLRVPVTGTRCDIAAGSPHHRPGHDHCAQPGSEPIGFSFAMHLENGLVAGGLVDDHASWLVLETSWQVERCPVRVEGPAALVCPFNDLAECPVDGHRLWLFGTWVEFDSYGSLMGAVGGWSRLTPRLDVDVSRSGPAPSAPPSGRGRRRVGTVTLEEYRQGMRP